MGDWILIGLLGIGSAYDLKKRRIPVLLIVAGAFAAGCLLVKTGVEYGISWDILSALVPGGIIAVLSLLTKQAIGMGDALIIMVAGPLIGAVQTWTLLVAACLTAAAAALVMVFIFKKGKDYELPFLPCLLAAHLMTLWN